MKFNYQARIKTGEVQAGTVEAASREAALSLLRKHGLYVTALEELEAPPFYARKIRIFERISKKDIVLFSRQLSIMFRSEVPLVESLRTLANQTKNLSFKEKLLAISEDVEGGTALSAAFSRHPKFFSPFYIAMVKSGEAAGKLSEVLDYLADHLEREYLLQSKIKGAMVYPLLVSGVTLVVLFLIVFFVMPQLTEVLEATGEELPLITRLMVGFATFLRRWAWALILGLIVLVIFLARYYRTSEGKRNFDKIFLRLPLVGGFLKTLYLSLFAENLSTLISGGLPIARALTITGEIVGNEVYKDIILKVKDEVQRGESISSVLQKYPEAFPPMFCQMTVVGEKTGTLGKILMNIVIFYQREVERAIDSFLSILEPALIIFLGVIVGGLIASILLPIYRTMGGL